MKTLNRLLQLTRTALAWFVFTLGLFVVVDATAPGPAGLPVNATGSPFAAGLGAAAVVAATLVIIGGTGGEE